MFAIALVVRGSCATCHCWQLISTAFQLALFWRNYSLDRTPGAGQVAPPDGAVATSEKDRAPLSPAGADTRDLPALDEKTPYASGGEADADSDLDERKTSGLDELGRGSAGGPRRRRNVDWAKSDTGRDCAPDRGVRDAIAHTTGEMQHSQQAMDPV